MHLYVDRINTGERQLLELSSSSFQPTFACFVSYILCDELACLNKSLGSRVNLGERYLCGSCCMWILRDSRDVGSHVGVSLSEPLLMQ